MRWLDMFLTTIKSEGLAHLSYLFGADGVAAVIDPRRDCEIYVEEARARGCRITHIFETHRNEDLLSGAPILAGLTGAAVHHGPHADGEVVYADTVRQGDCFALGALTEFSTLGHERANNPMLQYRDRDAFIAAKLAEHHLQPPYFRAMEEGNLEGATAMDRVARPVPLEPCAFEALRDDAVVLDVRGVTAWLGGHIPGSIALPAGMVPAFAGWLLDPGDTLLLVADDGTQAETAWRHLGRIGYDRVAGFLSAGLPAWAAQGRDFARVEAGDTACVARRLENTEKDWCLLDVRDANEVSQKRIEGSRHIYAGKLPKHLDELDKQRHHTTMCASGARATIAASLLVRAGFEKVDVYLGSMGAWSAEGRDTAG